MNFGRKKEGKEGGRKEGRKGLIKGHFAFSHNLFPLGYSQDKCETFLDCNISIRKCLETQMVKQRITEDP